jgi:hypothetical protein
MRIVTSSVTTVMGSNTRNDDNKNKSSTATDPKIPRGLRGLSSASITGSTDARSEYDSLQAEAAEIDLWWANPRFQHTKRVYSGKKKKLKRANDGLKKISLCWITVLTVLCNILCYFLLQHWMWLVCVPPPKLVQRRVVSVLPIRVFQINNP